MNHVGRFLMFLLVGAFLVTPFASAQTHVPVASCTQECDPKDPKVNEGIPKKKGDIVNVILYGHFEDILNQAPLNTQFPDTQQEHDLNRGFIMPVFDTNHGVGCSTGTCLDFHFKNNEFTMFSSPGLVEYLNEGWRTHQEPGLAADAVIAKDSFNLYWYLSAHAIPNESTSQNNGNTAKVGVMPQVAVYARMETGRHKFRGNLIAESDNWNTQSPPVAPPYAGRVNLITQPAEKNDVYEFVVKMNVKQKIIPSAESAQGFVVYVNPYQIKQGETGEPNNFQIAQADWRLRTGHKFPPRLVVPLENPMETKAATLSIFEERMFVRWSFVSALGSYDMRDASLTLTSTGQGKIDPKAVDFIILKRSVDHDGHFKPVNATWAIDYGRQNPDFKLADGEYQLTASILNLQETFLLEEKFSFTVKGGVPQVTVIGGGRSGAGGNAGGAQSAGGEAPGFEAGLLVFATMLGLAVVAIRRRKA